MTPEIPPQPQVVGAVVVDQTAIYNLLLEVRDDVRDVKKDVSDLKKDAEDHEVRIRSLETARWKIAGAGAGLGFVAGLLPTAISILNR